MVVFRLVILSCTTTPIAASQALAPVRGGGGSVAEQYLLRSINAERAAAGLRPVSFDPELWAAARFHADRMAGANTLAHQLQSEPELTARGSAAGAHFSRITENVAVGPSILQMHDALMRSPNHRENILDAAVTNVGVSVVYANGQFWAVEDFSHSVETLTYDEQEEQVARLLQSMNLPASPSADARATCAMATGYVGARPAFTMRYTTGNLDQLPEQLKVRIRTEEALRMAAVGACAPERHSGFTSYSVAVVLYR